MMELIAVIASALGVWLTARRHVLSWPIGLVSVALYAVIFYEARLYSDAMLQGFFAAMGIYGWWRWTRHLDDDGLVRPAPLRQGLAARDLVLGAMAALLLGYVMQRWTNASLPWIDAGLTCFSLVGSWWQAKRHIAAWILWIVVDVIYVGMFIFKSLDLTAVLYAGFVLLAIHGLLHWQKAARQDIQPECASQ